MISGNIPVGTTFTWCAITIASTTAPTTPTTTTATTLAITFTANDDRSIFTTELSCLWFTIAVGRQIIHVVIMIMIMITVTIAWTV
jgi:hypothetical protein